MCFFHSVLTYSFVTKVGSLFNSLRTQVISWDHPGLNIKETTAGLDWVSTPARETVLAAQV